MPRVHVVQNARISQKRRTCVTCGHEIQPGEMYRYAEPRVGPMLIWCREHTPRRSQLSNSKMGPLWDAIDDFNVANAESIEAIKSALEDIKNTAEEVKGEYEEGLSNMPAGLQEGQTGQETQEKIDALEQFTQELDNFDADLPDEDERHEAIEINIVREFIVERGAEPEYFQLDDSIARHQVLTLMEAFTEFETEVENRLENDDSLEEMRDKAVEIVQGFEY